MRMWVFWDTENHARTGLQHITLLLRTWKDRHRMQYDRLSQQQLSFLFLTVCMHMIEVRTR